MFRIILLATMLLLTSSAYAEKSFINFITPSELSEGSAVYITLADVKALLKGSFKEKQITTNGEQGEVNIHLVLSDEEPVRATRAFPSTIFPPTQFYRISSSPSPEGLSLFITSPAEMGLVYGLYALLQEKLGFRFYHPKQTYIPQLESWILPDKFEFEGRPLFDKRGFHLHTMHPIELTEQLHSRMNGEAIYDVKDYIDWLVRNGQNVMQFWLLRSVERDDWPDYAKEYVQYAKSRGVYTGVVISLSTLQQRAFQMVNVLKPFESYKTQIDKNLDWLMKVGFDYVCIDFTMGEYLPDLSKLLPNQKQYLIETIKKKYGVHVMENTHVIKREHSNTPECSGIVIHSVMFYSISEDDAPVYGNENQKFMYEIMQAEKNRRETWYWPESSYWVTFDTSVPLFLMPYLQSRHDDISLISRQGIDGHVTFTSGWEWGYWVIDYSIARWSWEYKNNGKVEKTSPVSVLADVFSGDAVAIFSYANKMQEKYLKDRQLISLLAAKTPFEELPWPFNKTFQPTSGFSMTKASVPFIGRKHREIVTKEAEMLSDFALDMDLIVSALDNNAVPTDPLRDELRREIIKSMEVTALRAKHRMYTMLAGAYRNSNLPDSSQYYVDTLLKNAEKTRRKANYIVTMMEKGYRYPVPLIARKMKGHTAYDFGYLYPVSDLYFWKREEEQVKGSRFDAFFMNLWNFWDTLGLDGLFK